MATRKKSSAKRQTKKERMAQIERQQAFKKEIFLWIVVAVSILLFISNFGIGGNLGNAVSGFLFGLFGMVAYIFPLVLLVGSFFAVSNKGNSYAIMKLVMTLVLIWFICVFMYLAVYGEFAVSPVQSYIDSVERHSGGGFIGALIGCILVPAVGIIGAYVVTIVVMIICLVLITGKSFMKGMRNGGRKVYESARENNERYQEYRQYKSRERQTREGLASDNTDSDIKQAAKGGRGSKRAGRRMDNKITGVSLDTKIDGSENALDSGMTGSDTAHVGIFGQGAAATDELGEITIENYPSSPAIKEKKTTSLTSGDAGEIVQTPDFGVASEPVSVLDGAAVASHVSQIPISGCVEPDISDDFGIQKDNELQSKLSAPAADAVMTKPPAAEPSKKKVKSDKDELAKEVEKVSEQIAINDAENAIQQKPYVFPAVDLLKAPDRGKTGDSQAHLRETAAKLEQTLNVFGVNAKVNNISCGPAVTRFEITPELGVKVSKIVNLADDIKLNLAAADIRIEAPIPGKAAVGIEVPNSQSVAVSFRELVESEEFKNAKSKITFAVGKDIAGKVKVTDIAKMPHLLIAGATGSGKSVCINTIIMSILYKAKPDEVKLIMIDPKVVELSVYNGIPHLMIPVVTDPKKAAGALNWAVSEMTDRYEKFANSGVREINGYNAMIDAMDGKDTEKPPKMPQIVIIVDELADLMMVASKDVEEAICRLAQLARAAGIHLIIATQRPSVNVITGLIKANMPSRIAFAVTSGVDSRTILDMNGAEKLLGKGDMLFDPQGVPKPLRVQGAFVSDKEVSDIVKFIIENNENAQYSNDVAQKMESLSNDTTNTTVTISDVENTDDGRDSYFAEAASIITDKERASIGMLQRYLKIGFNRAARIMDQLEEAGVVGPEEGTKPRKVLVTKEELDTILENN
ncbi:DNA translocase FtsK 4TM domain-containing protein [Agathobacter rectalis]|uniref:FtsK/SpoIIIE family DNA translocase n=1 Tax=Agathobacter rectalis TaxID=39491 RepID=UPI003ED96402